MDFAPRKYKDGIVFTAMSMKDGLGGKEKSKLYFSKIINGEQLSKPTKIKIKRYNDLDLGVLDILPSTNEVFVTMTDPFESGKKDLINLGLCTGIMEEGVIKNLEIISFCEPGIMSCHPTISDDGKLLIFSSKKEGQDDAQLYQSTRSTLDSGWSKPEPVETLHSEGNCLFPNFINDSLLVFSSNMPGGKGGFDLYTSTKVDGKWGKPESWTALNSKHDEVGMDMIDEKSGYFASDRDGSFDKIYFFKLEK